MREFSFPPEGVEVRYFGRKVDEVNTGTASMMDREACRDVALLFVGKSSRVPPAAPAMALALGRQRPPLASPCRPLPGALQRWALLALLALLDQSSDNLPIPADD